jgi:hypothetical protein
MAMTREPGYYWVRNGTRQIVMQYTEYGGWFCAGISGPIAVADDRVISDRIEPPSDEMPGWEKIIGFVVECIKPHPLMNGRVFVGVGERVIVLRGVFLSIGREILFKGHIGGLGDFWLRKAHFRPATQNASAATANAEIAKTLDIMVFKETDGSERHYAKVGVEFDSIASPGTETNTYQRTIFRRIIFASGKRGS